MRSHHEAEFIDIFSTPGDGKRLTDKYADTPPVYVHCQPGDVIFHGGFTTHMAKANRSDRTRRVYTAIYFADGAHRAGERPHPSVDRDRIAIGDVIERHMIAIGFIAPAETQKPIAPEKQVINLGGNNPPGLAQCPKCGQASLIRLENCDQCTNCDYSKCG